MRPTIAAKKETFDWEEIRKKASTSQTAKSTVEALEVGFKYFQTVWTGDFPIELTEWPHHYFCSYCAGRLKASFSNLYEHVCSQCGKKYQGEPYDGAWRAALHTAILTNLERAAVLTHFYPKERTYRQFVKSTVLYYAQNYHRYEVHGFHGGYGKVFAQGLVEAILVIHLERIMRIVKPLNLFTVDEISMIAEGFFRPAGELIKPQISKIHNIHMWMVSGVAAAANFLNDQEWLDFAIYHPYGFMEQLEQGTTEDGLWYEISPTYHFYVLEAFLSCAWVAKENGIDLFTHTKLKKMVWIPLEIAYKDGSLPAYNDGWFHASLSQYAGAYEQLSGMDSQINEILPLLYHHQTPKPCKHLSALDSFVQTPATSFVRNSVAALLYGPAELGNVKPQKVKSRIFPSAGIGILENDQIRVGMKFSGACGVHDHLDKLSIDFYANNYLISDDIGTSGYGLARTDQWNRTSVAHNMVVVNGEKQKPSHAKVLDAEETYLCVQDDQAYDYVNLKRSIRLIPRGFQDNFEVQCEQVSQLDWIFHCNGTIESVSCGGHFVEMCEAPLFSDGNGYDQISQLKSYYADKDLTIAFQTNCGMLRLNVFNTGSTMLYTGLCYGAEGQKDKSIVILRRKEIKTTFDCLFTIGEEECLCGKDH